MNSTAIRPAPEWARDLVIYELNPRTFTSPDGAGDGSGSGTFSSLTEKLPYLRDLGVNGIWMAGHHLATSHFYGIWTVYAVLEPQTIDPVLGTPDDLKALVVSAHEAGIRVFLDVIAHGVLNESPLIQEHPDWFAGGSWGMTDFDYENADFREWWINLWVNYATEFGIDGYRIDVAMGDIAVWDEIVGRLAALGREVVVFPENERYHFSQQDISGAGENPVRNLLIQDFLGMSRGLATAELSCHDYGWESLPGNHYYLKGSRALAAHGALLSPRIPLFYAGEEFNADPVHLPNLTQGLFGTGGPGGWLYGNRIDWQQLDDPKRVSMLDDVTTMLSIRKRYRHLINGDTSTVTIAAVPHDGAVSFVPFALGQHGDESIIVVTNASCVDVTTRIRLPLEILGFTNDSLLALTDVVTGEAFELSNGRADILLRADGQPGGGYRVLHLTRA